jgi:pyruvate kinase
MQQKIDSHRQTKIVATLGPATTEQKTIEHLIDAGLSVARMNMSHGSHDEHAGRIKNLRFAAKAKGAHVGVLVDLAGPKIRTGDLTTETVTLVPGKKIVLTTKKIVGTAERMSISYERLPREVKTGGTIMLDDGRRNLRVDRVQGSEIYCTILVGGDIKSRRGVNVPGAYLSISAITPKDKRDVQFALAQGAEFVALSFVRTADDVRTLRSLMKRAKEQPFIIAKIETPEALENIDAILQVTDGIMIARGDLAIEIPREQVPVIQKQLIRKARAAKKLVITATQMLETMVRNPVPTRAEVSDIANAIFDGTDAVMLSEESAMGPYAKEAIEVMRSVALATDGELRPRTDEITLDNPNDAVKRASCVIAAQIRARAIFAPTETGTTARVIAAFRPKLPIIAITDNPFIARQLSLVRGVWSIVHGDLRTTTALRSGIRTMAREYTLAKKGEQVVVVSGTRFGKTGSSNLLFIEEV